MEKIPLIPFMGDNGVTNDVTESQVADFILPQDKIPLLLALSLYGTPRDQLGDFVLVPNTYKTRFAVWFNQKTGEAIVGLRGTSVNANKGWEDVQDDSIIAYGANYCDLSIVNQVQEVLLQLAGKISSVVFVGHSLGGTAAFCLTSQIQNSRGIGLNSGAAPTNPILSGPGNRFTHYHIFGDLISSHMSPEAANVIIIKKSDGYSLMGSSYAHSSARILASDGSWRYATATEEDEVYQKWGIQYPPNSYITSVWTRLLQFLYYLKKKNIVNQNPIPGSERWNKRS